MTGNSDLDWIYMRLAHKTNVSLEPVVSEWFIHHRL